MKTQDYKKQKVQYRIIEAKIPHGPFSGRTCYALQVLKGDEWETINAFGERAWAIQRKAELERAGRGRSIEVK